MPRTRPLAIAIAVLLSVAPALAQDAEPTPQFAAYAASLQVGEPVTFENLSIYAVSRKPDSGRAAVSIESLDQALARGVAEIRERREAHEPGDGIYMSARNSGSSSIAILGGEVLKGSFQDRVVARDTIVPPDSRNFPVAVFCVEHGRSSGPRGESTGTIAFERTAGALAAPRIRALAGVWTRPGVSASQYAIWGEVDRLQSDLVEAEANQTSSYAVLAEGAGVAQLAGEAVAAFGPFDAGDDRVGFVVAINGKLVLADLFGSPDLARAHREKLLRSYAIEAHSRLAARARAAAPPDVDAARAFIGDALEAPVANAPTGGSTAYLLSGKRVSASASALGATVVHAVVFETPALKSRPSR